MSVSHAAEPLLKAVPSPGPPEGEGSEAPAAREATTEPVEALSLLHSAESQAAIDRSYAELLQEVRVAQTGVQFLLGFLMTLAFTPRFSELTRNEHIVYVVSLVEAFSAAAMLTAPVPFHRLVFRRGLKHRLVAVCNALTLAGVALLTLALGTSLLFVLTAVLGGALAEIFAAIIFSGFALLWFALPMWQRLRHGSR